MGKEEVGPELARLMVVGAKHGLDPVERIAMRRNLGAVFAGVEVVGGLVLASRGGGQTQ